MMSMVVQMDLAMEQESWAMDQPQMFGQLVVEMTSLHYTTRLLAAIVFIGV